MYGKKKRWIQDQRFIYSVELYYQESHSEYQF